MRFSGRSRRITIPWQASGSGLWLVCSWSTLAGVGRRSTGGRDLMGCRRPRKVRGGPWSRGERSKSPGRRRDSGSHRGEKRGWRRAGEGPAVYLQTAKTPPNETELGRRPSPVRLLQYLEHQQQIIYYLSLKKIFFSKLKTSNPPVLTLRQCLMIYIEQP